MGLEWDARKNAANLSKHGLGFEEASEIFDGPFFQLHDNRREYGEVRWRAYGVCQGRVLAVIFTWRGENRRIISARKANNEERRAYEILLQR